MEGCDRVELPTVRRSDSPVKPKDDAVEPIETAHEKMDENNSARTVAAAGTSKMDTSATDEVDGDISTGTDPGSIITKTMIEEETQLHKETEREEEKMKEEQEKLWNKMDQADREQRYKRLQFLLSKSSMYTRYLLERMEKQKEEEEKRKERKAKREEKLKEQKTKTSAASDIQTPDSQKLPVRSTRGKKSQGANSIDTDSSAPSSQESGASGKKSRKRKIESSNGDGQITTFFKAKGKRQKLEDGTAKDTSCNKESETKENKSDSVKVSKSELCEQATGQTDKNKSSQEVLSADDDDDDTKVFDGSVNGQPVLVTGGSLRDYQITGFSWLKTLYENGVNGILADEMGLGKTVQCVAMLSHLVNMGVPGPFLVCAPLSTIPNWHSEFRRFSPTVPVLLYHGTKEVRERIRNKIRRKVMVRPGLEVYPVVITSYEISMRDRKNLQYFDWRYLIVDEGHRIKNTQCRLIRELRLYQNTHRLLLTGTPLQNNLSELWSLLNFLLPEIFDDLGSFEAWFDVERISAEGADERIIAEEQQNNILSMLHQILTPFMLRRLKQDVDLHIPPKKELLVYAPLSGLQKEFYEATVDRTIFQKIQEKHEVPEKIEVNECGRPVRKSAKQKVQYNLMVGDDKDEVPKKRRNKEKEEEELESWVQAMIDNQNRKTVKEEKVKKSQVTIRMQNVMMQLRKCCNHPYLLEYPLDPKTGDYKVDVNLIKSSGKMLLLDKMLSELKARGHKVLIFSQMTKMLDILQDYCYMKSLTYCRLDGSSSVEERQEQMHSFNTDPDIFIFLLSTRAGGLGINLTAADTVIIYDSDWNPQSDLQAQDRCHRIGQTKPVVVYRFVTANTIDQKVVERAAAKRKLEKMVIHKGKFKSGMENYNETVKPLSAEELVELLRSKDHDSEIQSKEGEVIGDEELDSLLDRSDLYEKWGKEPKKAGKKAKAKKTRRKTTSQVGGLFKVIDTDDNACTENTDNTKQIPGVTSSAV